jgi:cyanophycinase
MVTKQNAGALIIIGGAEDKTGEMEILRRFVELAGGRNARILVIAVASEFPAEVASAYVEVFTGIGVESVRKLGVSHRGHANNPYAVEAIEKATGVFFTGGNQVRITSLLGGTKLDTVLHRRHEEGLVLAGTSAGAAMMSSVMIVGGLMENFFRVGIVELSSGMEFISGVLIDQHFEQRGRLRRLLSAVAQHPHDIGLGVDENTAGVVRDGILEVIGENTVTVIDAGELSFTNLPNLNENDILTLCGVKIHILARGYRFDLRNREPLVEQPVEENESMLEANAS